MTLLSRRSAFIAIILTATVLIASSCSDNKKDTTSSSTTSTTTTGAVDTNFEPALVTEVLLDGLENPWDTGFLPDKTLIFTERSGELSALKDGNVSLLATMPNINSGGEGGLLGLAVDSDFEKNRYVYTCFNSSGSQRDIRVVRFTINEDVTTATDAKPIVTGIEAKSTGRHSGCRVKSANDGTLFIGTGDAARSKHPQDLNSLNGKILHVDREGKAVEGNLSSSGQDARIFNYGHRNVQGVALFDEPVDGVYGLSVEHGSDRDDEVNLIKSGNFGWSPTGDYDESVAMTDTDRFPDAISAVWSSGNPTIATSGASFLSGTQWGIYDGALAVAVLKGERVKILKFDNKFAVTLDKDVLTGFGRIRSATQGPDGNLYITTDDDSNGKIIKVTPTK